MVTQSYRIKIKTLSRAAKFWANVNRRAFCCIMTTVDIFVAADEIVRRQPDGQGQRRRRPRRQQQPEAALQVLPGALHGAAQSPGRLRVRARSGEARHRHRLLPVLRPVHALPLHERRRGRFRTESLQVSSPSLSYVLSSLLLLGRLWFSRECGFNDVWKSGALKIFCGGHPYYRHL